MSEIPADLREAFEAYEAAIMANDLDALDGFFAPGPGSLRGDGAGLLVGHDAISAFRGVRGGVPARTIDDIQYRPLGDGAALLVSVSRYLGGGRGLQTQLWQIVDGRWLITAAHVTPRAQALDRSVWRAVGDPLVPAVSDGPLSGLTVAVKDLFPIAGHRVGAGNPTVLDEAPVETVTAAAVDALLRAGAAIRGIARTDEFAYSIAGDNVHYGTPLNGAVPGALPGGSSSGPATAVALGQAEIGLATDTAGSIRVPASYQGLWGLRTTHDLVPRQGMLPLAQSFDTIGWLTRDGDTMQRVAESCLGATSSGEIASRLLIPAEIVAAADRATREAFAALLSRLADADPSLRAQEVTVGELDGYLEPFRTVQGAEAWRAHGEWVRAHPGALGPAVAERFEAASRITPDQEASARAAMRAARARLIALIGDAALILPTAPGAAIARTAGPRDVDAARAATLRMTTPASVAGLPAVSVPLLTVSSSLGTAPVGVCLASRPGTDLALVTLARRIAALVTDA